MEFHGNIKRMFIPETLSFKIESPSMNLMTVDTIVFLEPGSMCTSIFHAKGRNIDLLFVQFTFAYVHT